MRKIVRVTAEVDLDSILRTAKDYGCGSGDPVVVDVAVRYLGVPIHCETLEDAGNVVKFAIDHDAKILEESLSSSTPAPPQEKV